MVEGWDCLHVDLARVHVETFGEALARVARACRMPRLVPVSYVRNYMYVQNIL